MGVGVNQDVAERLVQYVLPIMWGWFYLGFVISILYHLSLYYLDGEFRIRGQRSIDLFVSVLRGLLYTFIWPAIFFFDTSALERIKLFFLYLNPKERENNQELKMYLKEKAYRRWVTGWYSEQVDHEEQVRQEAATGEQRRLRMREVHEGNDELDATWMLSGVSQGQDGVRELVTICPEYYLADEVAARAREEVKIRRGWTCLRCNTLLEPEKLELPDLEFLRVVEPGSGSLVVEGWALRGKFTMSFGPCPRCGTAQPPIVEPVSSFGRASDVVRQVRAGLNLHWDLP